MRWLAIACAAFAASCGGGDPPTSTTSTGGGGNGTGGANTGAGGQGGSDAPVVESLTTDVILVTALPTDVVFTAILSDAQGVDDIVGGNLNSGDPNDAFGDFAATGVQGGYQFQLAVDDTYPWPDQGYRLFIATFSDSDGNVTEESTAIEFDIGGCTQQPDHAACRACFCNADPVGCASFASYEYQQLYCGSTCSATCFAFCQSVGGGTPDPLLIDAPCAACQPSVDDIAAFETACLADIPDCFGFLVDVYNCPR